MTVSEEQYRKAPNSISVRLASRVMVVKAEQRSKALPPITAQSRRFWKAPSPIAVTLSGCQPSLLAATPDCGCSLKA